MFRLLITFLSSDDLRYIVFNVVITGDSLLTQHLEQSWRYFNIVNHRLGSTHRLFRIKQQQNEAKFTVFTQYLKARL